VGAALCRAWSRCSLPSPSSAPNFCGTPSRTLRACSSPYCASGMAGCRSLRWAPPPASCGGRESSLCRWRRQPPEIYAAAVAVTMAGVIRPEAEQKGCCEFADGRASMHLHAQADARARMYTIARACARRFIHAWCLGQGVLNARSITARWVAPSARHLPAIFESLIEPHSVMHAVPSSWAVPGVRR
jgi:hypothetical protein